MIKNWFRLLTTLLFGIIPNNSVVWNNSKQQCRTMVKLYHYTSEDGYSGIITEGIIRSSKNTTRDAVLGEGVYLTSLPPWTKDIKLLKNNWDGGEQSLLRKLNYLDYYIEFDSDNLRGAQRARDKRDIWLVPYDIDLEKVPHKICRNPTVSWGQNSVSGDFGSSPLFTSNYSLCDGMIFGHCPYADECTTLSGTMVKLYHYTSAKGCSGILDEGIIRRSTNTKRDAILGKGVYLTSLPPRSNDMKLVKNNWDGRSEQSMLKKLDKVDCCIEVDSRDLPGARKSPGKRDVWMVPYDIDLEEVPYDVYEKDVKHVARN